jgi:hypothetical protein
MPPRKPQMQDGSELASRDASESEAFSSAQPPMYGAVGEGADASSFAGAPMAQGASGLREEGSIRQQVADHEVEK